MADNPQSCFNTLNNIGQPRHPFTCKEIDVRPKCDPVFETVNVIFFIKAARKTWPYLLSNKTVTKQCVFVAF